MAVMLKGMSREKLTFLGVVLCALAVRLVFLHGFVHNPLFSQVRGQHDRALYHQAAAAVAEGAVWPEGAFTHLPLYPWVLGSVYAVTGPRLKAAAGLGLLCDALTVILLVGLARRLGASSRWAAAAGLLYAAYPRAVVYATLSMPTSLNVLLLTALAFDLARPGPRTAWAWCRTGLLAGVTGLGYPAVWPALALLVVIPLPNGERRLPRLLALLVAVLPALPVILHNTRAEGRLTLLTTHGGINYYMGNHEQATGYPLRIRDFRMTALELQADAHRFAETEAGRALSRSESSAWWSEQARRFMREQPGSFLRLLARKFRLFWSGTEVDDLRMVEQVRLMTGQLQGWQWPCFALFSAAGLFGLLRAGPAPGVRLLAWTCIGSVVSLFITTRYRLPLVPLLAAFGAAGMTVLGEDIRAWKGPRLERPLPGHVAALLLAMGLAAWPGGLKDVRGTDYYNASVQWLAAGRHAEALAAARAGLALEPASADLHHAEGGALFQLGRYHDAAAAFAHTVEARPAYATARYNLALSLARDGQACAALRVLEEAPASDERMIEFARTLRPLCEP